MTRWGHTGFRTSDPGRVWDGTLKGSKQDSDVFVWTCRYQFEGEPLKLGKGVSVLIR